MMNESTVAFLRGFVHAASGIAHVVFTQRNMRVHITIAVLATLVGLWLSLSSTEWAIIALAMGGVFMAETMKTAVERIVDLVSPGQHTLAKVAKDASAGAVLIMAIFAAVTGLLIFLPKVLLFLGL